MKTERDNALAALHNLLGYFRSGNRIGVERATIRAESKEVQQAFETLRDPKLKRVRRKRVIHKWR